MSKIEINVYTNMNSIQKKQYINAIRSDNIIKYIDLQDKFVVDLDRNILIKENNEFISRLLFYDNCILIFVKELNKEFKKDIEVIEIISDKKIFYVKYRLIEENIINEYKIEIL